MARMEWVEHRLNNWALWKERERSGGLGYATRSSFLNELVDGGRYREARIPVDEVDASVTDEAVESLKVQAGRSHLYVTLTWIYVQGIGVKQTAWRMNRAESTVRAQLGQADQVLAEWFRERKQRMLAVARAQREAIDAGRPAALSAPDDTQRTRIAGTLTLRRA
jgi:hypothetical protein